MISLLISINCDLWKDTIESRIDLVSTPPLNLVLRKQVRRMVSAVLQVSRGKMTPDDIQKLIEFPAHTCLSYQVVPAHGLYLVKVSYDDAVLAVDWTRKPASEKYLSLLHSLHEIEQSLQARTVTNK